MSDEDTCFVVSPIGEEGSDTRERSDKLFEYVIEPAVSPHGYEPIRSDQIAEPGMITSQIIDHIVDSPLVIADLTGSNANVFYELAIRHALQKPLIQLISVNDSIPFDVAGTRTIQIDLSDIESVENAKSDIRDQISNLDSGDQNIETPISVALNLRDLKDSTDPDDRSMADIMETLTEVRTNIITLQNKLEEPEEVIPPEYIEDIFGDAFDQDYMMIVERLDQVETMVDDLYHYLEENEALDDNIERDLSKIAHNVMHLKHVLREEAQRSINTNLNEY
ncbi:hypothetical protein [Halorubrum sp. Atlit-26R]|uniref:hypothetical protein n=1 Tax=Halorubrum sp. Atlit-26R TaxID=2282128 RepID=UPI0011C36BBF|nr:hypothetical protein [Halorubrum sp. Atlit-26R]